MRRILPYLFAALLPVLAGCEMLGIESASAAAARREAEGKAVGGACRHAGRAIEDCYTLNKRAEKSAVYAGWREMNDYMRENKIDPVAPVISAAKPGEAASAPVDDDDAPAKGKGEGKRAKKVADRG